MSEITLERIKRIAKDIKEDDEWVNDSHTRAEHIGVCDGLDRLIEHLEETQGDDNEQQRLPLPKGVDKGKERKKS